MGSIHFSEQQFEQPADALRMDCTAAHLWLRMIWALKRLRVSLQDGANQMGAPAQLDGKWVLCQASWGQGLLSWLHPWTLEP